MKPTPENVKLGGPDAPYRKQDKAAKGPKPKNLAVQVAREYDGSVYSRVIDKAEVNPWNGEPTEVVIDRKTRLLDARIIKMRAEHLARLLGLPFEEDMRWPCQANKKMACRCPKCIESGRA